MDEPLEGVITEQSHRTKCHVRYLSEICGHYFMLHKENGINLIKSFYHSRKVLLSCQ